MDCRNILHVKKVCVRSCNNRNNSDYRKTRKTVITFHYSSIKREFPTDNKTHVLNTTFASVLGTAHVGDENAAIGKTRRKTLLQSKFPEITVFERYLFIPSESELQGSCRYLFFPQAISR